MFLLSVNSCGGAISWKHGFVSSVFGQGFLVMASAILGPSGVMGLLLSTAQTGL